MMHHPSKIVYLSSNVSIPGSDLLEGASQLVFSKHYMKNTGRAPAGVTPKPRADEVSRTSSRRREQDSPTKGCLRRKLSIILIDLRILRVLLTLFWLGLFAPTGAKKLLRFAGRDRQLEPKDIGEHGLMIILGNRTSTIHEGKACSCEEAC